MFFSDGFTPSKDPDPIRSRISLNLQKLAAESSKSQQEVDSTSLKPQIIADAVLIDTMIQSTSFAPGISANAQKSEEEVISDDDADQDRAISPSAHKSEDEDEDEEEDDFEVVPENPDSSFFPLLNSTNVSSSSSSVPTILNLSLPSTSAEADGDVASKEPIPQSDFDDLDTDAFFPLQTDEVDRLDTASESQDSQPELSTKELEELQSHLQSEGRDVLAERQKEERAAKSVTEQLTIECQVCQLNTFFLGSIEFFRNNKFISGWFIDW